ncbi:MAG: histidinol-phosphatase HisJ family protein [Lachnospiraceae bacterium]|nr:histidinol-phosphatase HisJ family protein [Lachnospiraceae bacterium]
MSDCHVHSTFSGDAESSMEDMILKAIDKGLQVITFTDHCDMDFPYKEGEEGLFDLNTDSYLYDILRFREKYGDKIEVGFGVEIGMQTSCADKNTDYVREHDFDFVIASLHLVDGYDPYYPEYYEGKTEKEAYGRYFELLLENIRLFNDYDVVGHLDYIVRYGKDKDANYRYEDYKDVIDEILKEVIAGKKGLEVNTAGLRKGTKDVHPTYEILKRYKELGGEIITIGSDAHRTDNIAADFDSALKVLKEVGFEYYCIYRKRQPLVVKL